tara:strand:+ start:12846 stop:13472 length:627 start_codon:yes stop_codon:yes gene_type:complete
MIEPKLKPCKGTSKAIGNGCGKKILNRNLGLCKKCYSNWLLNTPEGKERLSKHTLKVTAPRTELKRAIKAKQDRTKLQYLKVSVQTWCHRFIKERDKGKNCVSCGEPWSSDHQAGHWKKASDYSTLKFWQFNIHNQCQGCNLMKDGNVQKYADRILKRITQEQKNEIEKMCIEEKHSDFKWDREELKELREFYKEKYHLQKLINDEKC